MLQALDVLSADTLLQGHTVLLLTKLVLANWYEAMLMHPVTADPRISGVLYSSIALRTGVDWPERRTMQEPLTVEATMCMWCEAQ